ncbi:CXXC motif containing zinc binding protein [Linum perenne]
MVNYTLMITGDLENIATLQPRGGCDDPTFSYFFKLKCGSCGEVSQKETCVVLEEKVQLPSSKGTANLVQKCKFCGREGNVSMIPGKGKPLTQESSEAGKYVPLMMFDCRGYEPEGFLFGSGWIAQSESGTKFEDIDLSGGDFMEYDEKGECAVMISNLSSKFDVTR